MKHLKKMLALVVAVAMVLGMMSMSAFAEETTYKITIEKNANNDDHTYTAYQILTGTLDEDEESDTYGQLTNLAWGTGVNGETLLTALKADATIGTNFTDCDSTAASVAAGMAKCSATTAADALAAVIGAYVDSADLTAAGTSEDNVISGLVQGYYFVKDVTETLTLDTKSEYMLQVVGDVEVTAKDSTVTLEKKVDDKNDSTTGEDDITWQDSADYDIGDTIPYMLKGTLPSNYAKYDFFDYKFTDEMSTGLTLNEDSIKVVYYADADALAVDTTATGGTDITDEFTTTVSGQKFTVGIASEVADDGTVSDAGLKKIDGITKDSVIVVYYTAVLNENAVIGAAGNDNKAKLEFSNNPNATSDGDNTKSETPEDTNIVFTYKVVVNKVDQNKQPLAGATFALYKEVASTATGAQTGAAIKESLDTAVEASALEDEKFYVVIGTIEATKADGATSYTANFNGVDDGNYVLVETVVPSGYNSWNSQAFTVSAEHSQDPDELKLTSLTGGDLMTGTVDTGTLETEIKNQSGSVLPATGGIGTTIFYVVGALLVIGAGVVLITRRRMDVQ